MIKILRENNNELKTIPIECVKGATLLSKEEAKTLMTETQRKAQYMGHDCSWWLRNIPNYSEFENVINYVSYDGEFGNDGVAGNLGVRPALIVDVQCAGFNFGDQFVFDEYEFTVISNNLAICNEIVGKSPFNKKWDKKNGDVYEQSDIRVFVQDWFDKCWYHSKKLRTDKEIADDFDLGF